MIELLNPKDIYVTAILDDKQDAIKLVCNVLMVSSYNIDTQTAPMTSLIVTFAHTDPKQNFMRSGPFTQHMISGDELIKLLEEPGGITIDTIEDSVLKTGLPASHVAAEDMKKYEGAGPVWSEFIIAGVRKQVEEIKKIQETAMAARPPGPIQIPVGPEHTEMVPPIPTPTEPRS